MALAWAVGCIFFTCLSMYLLMKLGGAHNRAILANFDIQRLTDSVNLFKFELEVHKQAEFALKQKNEEISELLGQARTTIAAYESKPDMSHKGRFTPTEFAEMAEERYEQILREQSKEQ